MKKIKLSLVVLFAMIGAMVMSFTTTSTISTTARANQWYGQPSDAVPPYNKSYPLTPAQAAADCPTATQHICAVELDMNGNLVATIKSAHNFTP